MLKYELIQTGPFMENCYLLWDDNTMEAIYIDPGDDADKLVEAVESRNLNLVGIYNTHGHLDHTGAAVALVNRFDVPFAVHRAERSTVESLPHQPALFGMSMKIDVPDITIELKEGQEVSVGGYKGKVIDTPGHTPGGVCFLFESLLFSGDTLFAGSIGRSDLPGGNGRQLLSSIIDKLMVLPDDTVVLPGHGPATTIALEKQHNPFVNGAGIF